ncbi:hypothetical protein BH09BAC1_BH09BAC1_29450 [soil metagenome]
MGQSISRWRLLLFFLFHFFACSERTPTTHVEETISTIAVYPDTVTAYPYPDCVNEYRTWEQKHFAYVRDNQEGDEIGYIVGCAEAYTYPCATLPFTDTLRTQMVYIRHQGFMGSQSWYKITGPNLPGERFVKTEQMYTLLKSNACDTMTCTPIYYRYATTDSFDNSPDANNYVLKLYTEVHGQIHRITFDRVGWTQQQRIVMEMDTVAGMELYHIWMFWGEMGWEGKHFLFSVNPQNGSMYKLYEAVYEVDDSGNSNDSHITTYNWMQLKYNKTYWQAALNTYPNHLGLGNLIYIKTERTQGKKDAKGRAIEDEDGYGIPKVVAADSAWYRILDNRLVHLPKD